MTRERLEVFREYLEKWPWEQYETMPIAKVEADYLLELFARKDRDAERSAAWYQAHRDQVLEQANKRNKEKAYIKKGVKDVDIWKQT